MTDYNCSAILKDLCAYSIYFLVKSCVYKRAYLFLILLLTDPFIKYRGLDKTVALTNDQKAIQIHTKHGNLTPYYDNGEAFYVQSQSARQFCAQFSATLFLCLLYSIEKSWYLKFRNDFAMVLFHLIFLSLDNNICK